MRTTTYILLFSLLVALDSAFAKNAAPPVCVTHFLEFDTSDKALKRKAVVIDSALKLLLQKYDKQAAIRYIDPRSIGDSSLVIPDSISAQAKDIASSYLTSKGVDVEVVLNVRLSPDPAGIEVVFESRYCETGRILHQLRLTFIPQNSPQETSQLIDAALKTIFAELNESRTAYGFPFAENDRGVIVVVDESPDSLLLPVLDSFGALFAAMPADSVIFRFFKPSPLDSLATNSAHRLLDSAGQTGARIVLEPVFDDSTKTLSHISD